MRKFVLGLCLLFSALLASAAHTQEQRPTLSQETLRFVGVDAPVVALTHVRVIDGTGAPPLVDQTVVIAAGKIQSIGPAATSKVPEGAKVLEMAGRSVMPGLVLMHEHLFYPTGRLAPFHRTGKHTPQPHTHTN